MRMKRHDLEYFDECGLDFEVSLVQGLVGGTNRADILIFRGKMGYEFLTFRGLSQLNRGIKCAALRVFKASGKEVGDGAKLSAHAATKRLEHPANIFSGHSINTGW
jgi:hypothetical protein